LPNLFNFIIKYSNAGEMFQHRGRIVPTMEQTSIWSICSSNESDRSLRRSWSVAMSVRYGSWVFLFLLYWTFWVGTIFSGTNREFLCSGTKRVFTQCDEFKEDEPSVLSSGTNRRVCSVGRI